MQPGGDIPHGNGADAYPFGRSRQARHAIGDRASRGSARHHPSHYVDYQDCKYAGRRTMVCTGVSEIRRSRDDTPFRLGGIELIDLSDHRPLHQVPQLQWANGTDLTHNAASLEPTAGGVRGYLMPEDDRSTVCVLEANITR